MNKFDSIEALALKKKAVESVLSESSNVEILAERLILLLDGDMTLLDYLISGVPYDVLDPANLLNVEKYLKEKEHIRLERIKNIVVNPKNVAVSYEYTARVWLRPDNTDGMQRIQGGGHIYNEDMKYSETKEYSMPCDYTAEGNEELVLRDLILFGVEFKRL